VVRGAAGISSGSGKGRKIGGGLKKGGVSSPLRKPAIEENSIEEPNMTQGGKEANSQKTYTDLRGGITDLDKREKELTGEELKEERKTSSLSSLLNHHASSRGDGQTSPPTVLKKKKKKTSFLKGKRDPRLRN